MQYSSYVEGTPPLPGKLRVSGVDIERSPRLKVDVILDKRGLIKRTDRAVVLFHFDYEILSF